MKISLYNAEECEKIAKSAALRYVNDKLPGIYRSKRGKGFCYYDSKGIKIVEETLLERINSLAIPPAYTNVWICKNANGHIQATGIDERKRKQYIYHPLWHETRQKQKFDSLIDFGRSLPRIRRRVKQQLNKPLKLNKEQVLCAIIYLLDISSVRIGNPLYAKQNKSYGISTIRKKHLSLTNKKAELNFPGKNAHLWHVILEDKNLIKLLKKCEEIPGYELFKYYDELGELHLITSQDINGYLKSLTNHSFTAKTFRTWIACREIFSRLMKSNASPNKLKPMICEVAMLLGHTPAICRKNYIDPNIISHWEKGYLSEWANKQKISPRNKDKLFLMWLENKIY